jgi:hypothetical protein
MDPLNRLNGRLHPMISESVVMAKVLQETGLSESELLIKLLTKEQYLTTRAITRKQQIGMIENRITQIR